MVACLKRLLPVGLNLFAGREQELVQHCKDRFLKKMQEYEISEFAKTQLTLPDKIDPADEMSWQHYLYSKLGQQKDATESVKAQQLEDVVARITDMAKVLYGLHMVSHRNFSVFNVGIIFKIYSIFKLLRIISKIEILLIC